MHTYMQLIKLGDMCVVVLRLLYIHTGQEVYKISDGRAAHAVSVLSPADKKKERCLAGGVAGRANKPTTWNAASVVYLQVGSRLAGGS